MELFRDTVLLADILCVGSAVLLVRDDRPLAFRDVFVLTVLLISLTSDDFSEGSLKLFSLHKKTISSQISVEYYSN